MSTSSCKLLLITILVILSFYEIKCIHTSSENIIGANKLMQMPLFNIDTVGDFDAGYCEGYTNSTSWKGKELLNFTFDLQPRYIYIEGGAVAICCSSATNSAGHRSKNSTNPIGWSLEILGDSKTHKGQVTLRCTAYDYGITRIIHQKNLLSGMTGRLTPFPTPPPACPTYESKTTCPTEDFRCFWYGKKCNSQPPIQCGVNTPKGWSNMPLCIHLEINTSKWGEVTYLSDEASYNETVIVKPPKQITNGDAWFSVADGIKLHPTVETSYRYCTQYSAVCNECKSTNASTYLAICLSLNGGIYDLQVSVNQTLFSFAGKWVAEPFIANVVVNDLSKKRRNYD